MVAGLVLLVALMIGLWVALKEPFDELQRSTLAVGLATAAAATSLPAGVLLVNHYRFGGRRSDLDAGVIVLLTSSLWLLPSLVLPVVSPAVRSTSPLLGMGIAVTVLWLAITSTEGRSTAQVPAGQAFLRIRAVAASAALCAVVLGIVDWLTPQHDVTAFVSPFNVALFGLGALVLLIRGYHSSDPALSFIGMNLLGLELGYVLTAGAASSGSGAWLGAAFISLVGAIIGMWGVLRLVRVSAESRQGDLLAASLYRVQTLQFESLAEERLHDLRSGLLSVEAFATTLDVTPSVDLLVEEVARLRELVSASHSVERIDVHEIIAGVVRARAALGVSIEYSGEPELGLLGVRSDLCEVIQNVVDNSVRHVHAAHIRIDASRVGDRVSITISDDGTGFDEEFLPVLFERGFSTHNDGTGLGLHIVRRLVGQLGGDVALSNGPDGGAVVHLEFPSAELDTASVGTGVG